MASLYAELEITLSKRSADFYAANFRFNRPNDEAEQSFPSDEAVTFDLSAIRSKRSGDYAAVLTTAFFTPVVKNAFLQALAASEDRLRVRLSIEPSATELHALHWEMLNDPRSPDSPLFMGDNIVCSRFLTSSQDWKPIRLKPKTALRALVVAANPSYLNTGDGYVDEDDIRLVPVDIAGEIGRAREALQSIEVIEAPATLSSIIEQLRQGVDILYLVCHGVLKHNVPILHLEDVRPVPGKEFAQRIRELEERPRLIVLVSCQSAGAVGTALSALGPLLAEAGVPAVVAMQGKVSMAMIRRFMPRFFSELIRDGQIDRAVSVARGEVRDSSHDYWMPALFLRLRDGRIWYTPGFEGDKGEFEQWRSICESVRDQECVPILGPDFAEHLLGSTHDFAACLASDNSYPLDRRDQHDLAKVAQYLSTNNGPKYARSQVRKEFASRLASAARRILGHASANPAADLAGVLSADRTDPLRIAASLPALAFVDASGNELLLNFLQRAATSQGEVKAPVPIAVNWRDERRNDKSSLAEPAFEPSAERPLLYYVFGRMPVDARDEEAIRSWVLTEDDFFDYLIKTSRYSLTPKVVSSTLLSGTLLFLGFSLEDWKFRVLLRLIWTLEGSDLLTEANHVAVQVDPGETTLANARRGRKYLETYFSKTAQIDLYWGTAADFLRDLDRRLHPAKTGATHA